VTQAIDEIDPAVVAKVLAAIREVVGDGKGPIVPEQVLEKDLGVDSLEFVRLIQVVEDALDVRIDDQAAAGVVTVADLVAVAARAGADA
jgi:acyl carrier protein